MNITTRLAGFHFRPATRKDVWGYEVPIYTTPGGAPCQAMADGAKQTGTRWVFEDLKLPVMLLHGFRVSNRGITPRKPKQPALSLKRVITAKDWRKRGVMINDSDLKFGRTPRQWQIKMRKLRDQAGAALRREGIWNPSVTQLHDAMAAIYNRK
jgi:hypothetical protein